MTLPPPNPAEVAGVIAGLTKAQRLAIIHGHGTVAVCRRLREIGIAERVEGTSMAWSAFPIFSHLGVRIRAQLQSEGNPDAE